MHEREGNISAAVSVPLPPCLPARRLSGDYFPRQPRLITKMQVLWEIHSVTLELLKSRCGICGGGCDGGGGGCDGGGNYET